MQSKIIAIILFAFLYIFPATSAQAALIATQIRYSDSAEKTRIVVDINENINLINKDGFTDRIAVELGKGTVNKNLKNIILSNSLVKQAKIFTVNKDQLILDIMLDTKAQYNAFILKNPWRLVVDILKEYDIKEESQIEQGLTYTLNQKRKNGRVIKAHYLTIKRDKWQIKPIMANDSILTRSSLTNMSKSSKAIALINASYFGQEGWVIGNCKIDNQFVGIEHQLRTALLIYANNEADFNLINYTGQIQLPSGKALDIKGVNRVRAVDDLVLYQSEFAKSTGTNQYGCEILIDKTGKVLDINFAGNTTLAKDQFVISGHGIMANALSQIKIGDKIILKQSLGEKADKAKHVLGAGPRLIENDIIVTGENKENFLPDIFNGRAPRTAVGINKQGDIIFYVADGRSKESIGLTLLELAQELKAMGVVNAMNLDGGGSSQMVIKGKTINNPSDGKERNLATALGVFQR